MSIKYSAVLTGLLFAAIFTIPQKAPAQATETGNTPQTTETEAILKPPYLIHELLYQVGEVNRKLQAGVVIQCRCSSDYWWPIYSSVSDSNDSVNDDSGGGGIWWPEDYKIVRGYGYNMRSAKWDAMQACGPIAVPFEEESPTPPLKGNQGEKAADNGSTKEINIDDSLMEKAFTWCRKSKRFIHH